MSAPRTAETSIDALARYLAAGAHGDEEKARSIFRWVSGRLTYDTKAFFAGNPPQDYASAFATRRAVCAGYTGLYLALASRMGLHAERVVGISKGFGFEANSLGASRIKHAWIAVKLKDGWVLMDPTWASGALGRDGKFHKRFNDYWFETPPAQMVHDHFPDLAKWQLLDSPWSQERFRNSPRVSPRYFASGLQPITHRAARIDVDCDFTMRFQGPKQLLLTAALLPAARGENWTWVSRKGDETSVLVRCPGPGNFRMRVYGRTSDGKLRVGRTSYDWLCEYQVHSTEPAGRGAFPQAFSSFVERDAQLLEPLQAVLVAGRRQTFRLIVPGAIRVRVDNGARELELRDAGDFQFEGESALSKGELTIFALYPGDKRFFGLVKYKVRQEPVHP